MSHPNSKGYNEVTPSPSTQGRRRLREDPDDAPYTPDKREQTRERQRKKREREKANSSGKSTYEGSMDGSQINPELTMVEESDVSAKRKGNNKKVDLATLPPDEAAKRERMRLAARERQRKHRAGVKARRLAELGVTIVNEGGGIEQTAIGYTVNENEIAGQYEAVLVNPNDPNLAALHPHPQVPVGLPTHGSPGQLFTSILLFSLSLTPQLKQNLLRYVHATNEEVAAFAPYMATAFDHWDHSRMTHYAQQNHQASTSQGAPPAPPYPIHPQFGLDRFPRPLVPVSFPAGSVQPPEQSPSPSEESHHDRIDSEVRIEPPVPPDPTRPPPSVMYNQVDVQRVEGLKKNNFLLKVMKYYCKEIESYCIL
ncbi:hypothetical protein Clacol_006282 [Clathrus columnatus]|uniref:BZIP domain-containing protein n=1 Tax=Clathrus columnatus TaxID=1419009 RepID=A0AAV5AGE8_9AGAM|nr:hypothetical protein Clacol_006282 [Clathrus columnatus]